MDKVTIRLKQKDYHVKEAYKTLRTNLQFCGEDKKIILITSCQEDEGKSNVSLSLAASLAESGKKTLLIDADMRKSVFVGDTVRTEKEINGLSHYLSSQCALQDTIYSSNLSNLFVICSGPFPPNPAELLNSEKFDSMFAALRKVFDYVIIDSPPIGNVIDGAIIAKNCDGICLVIEAGATSYHFALSVMEQLRRSETPILGVILNKVDQTNAGYGRYYGKYYGKYYSSYGSKSGRGA